MATITVSTPTGVQTTRRPSISWSADFTPSGGYTKVWVFTAAAVVNEGGEETVVGSSNPFFWGGASYESTNLPSSATSHTPTSDLPFGSLRAVVLQFGGLGWVWDVGPTFSFEDTLSVPTGIVPAASATLTTNLPLLQATLVASTYSSPQFAEWQFATDAGFTTNVVTVTEAATDARTSGITTEQVTSSYALFAGSSWRVRARAKNAGGTTSSWSSTNTFTVSHPPAATVTSPTNGSGQAWNAGAVTIGWAFSSTSSDMVQSAYQVVIQKVSDLTTVYDSAKVASTATSLAVTGISASYKGVQLQAKVRLWDTEDVVGSYSDISTFTLHDTATVTVTGPTGTITTPIPTVTWTFTPSTGGAQNQYKVVIASGTTTVYDTGWIVGSATSYPLPIAAGLTTATTYTTTVYTRDLAGVEASDTDTFATLWTPPAAPTYTVEASTYDDAGPVTILIDTSLADQDFAGWRVKRRDDGDTDWTTIYTSYTLDAYVRVADYTAKANVAQEYTVEQLANRYGVVIATATADLTVTDITPVGTHYWLIVDDNTEEGDTTAPAISTLAAVDSILLWDVEGDSYSRQIEQATIPLIGRGKKVEYGTDYGVTGQLNIRYWERTGLSAHEQRVGLDDFKATRTSALLRNPFGDVWTVAVADIALTRVPAPGTKELATVAIPYTEVAD